MNLKKTFLALIAVISFINASAQNTWSLKDCIDYAHENNLRIKQTQLQANVAENNLLQSKISIAPNLNAGVNRTYGSGHFINPATNEFVGSSSWSDSYGLSSSWNLFSGLQTYNSIKANEFNALSKMSDVEKEKINISLEIASAYLMILFNKELHTVAGNQRDVTALQVDRTQKLVEAGSVARGDYLEIAAQLSAEELSVANAKNDYNLSVLNLTQLLDLDSVGNFSIIEPDTIQPDFNTPITDVTTVYNEGLEFLPHVKSAEYDLETYKRVLAIRRGAYSPSLGLNGSWGTIYSDSDDIAYWDQLNNLTSKSLRISLNIPIFNRYQVKNSVDNAKIDVLRSETTLEQTKQQLYKEIQQAYNDAISAQVRYNAATEAVKSYKEAFTYMDQKSKAGMVNFVEYNIAKNNYIKAESDQLQAKYAYVFAVKILDFYRGIPITL